MDEATVQRLRADTPACASLAHFNNAGASLVPDPVFNAVAAHLELERRNGGYEAEAMAAGDLAAFYTEFAGLLNADPSEIAFVENATRAWDMVFYGLALERGDRIATHSAEYVSGYLAFLQLARAKGVEIDLIPSDESGQIDLAALEAAITPRTRLIALTHAPTQGGLVNPAEEVGHIAAKHGIFYLLDACQSVGQIDVDVQRIGCDALSGTGRKFLRGPRGTGFLYVRRQAMAQIQPPFIDLRAATWTGPDSFDFAPDATRFETWESNVAGRIGLMTAVRYARSIGLPAIEARITSLAATLREGLSALPGVTVHDKGRRKSGIVTFLKDGETAPQTTARLRARGINTSVSNRTSAQLDLGARGLDALTRASVHYYNTEDEIGRLIEAVGQHP